MTRIFILEGVTGAGKSSVLAELRSRVPSDVTFILEDETLGAIMEQSRDPRWRAAPTFDALDRVLDRVERELARRPDARFVLERFHLSAFARFPKWEHLAPYDARLAALGARQALLTYPEPLAEARSIERADRLAEGWAAGMDAFFGLREDALEAVVESQRNRIAALEKSTLPFLRVDTREGAWCRYADVLVRFADLSRSPAPRAGPRPDRARDVHLRDAVEADLDAINGIYNHYVATSTATYQIAHETLESRQAWFRAHDPARHPVIVAERAGSIVGWGSLTAHHPREGYARSVETSIYLHHEARGLGLGTALLAELVARARRAGHHVVIAGIDGDQAASFALHQRFGFVEVARFREIGFKFGDWRDVAYLQLTLTD